MNYCVPDFEMDENYVIPSSSSGGLTRPKKSPMAEDEVMELLWQNGQVVMQSQNHRSFKKSPLAADQTAPRDFRPLHQNQLQQPPTTDHLFLQEDEMASWLHYPLNDANFDNDFSADLFYAPAPCVTSTATTTAAPSARAIQHQANFLPALASASAVASSSRPPIPPARRIELDSSKIQNFTHLSKLKPMAAELSEPSNTRTALRESTVVDSCESPVVIPESRGFQMVPRNTDCLYGVKYNNACAAIGTIVATSTHSAGISIGADATCDVTLTSSPGGSSASAEPPAHKAASQNRKRKGVEAAEDGECHAKDAELESPEGKKQTRGSTSTKRSRAAEVHNLSERRRRDRINEKMRALQELIPRCNKSDKASMLDEAIEYLKSLQLQVQMMSMGCGMVPMMFPGVQQFMPPMGMGMGMGMGMDMGMNRPMMPFPNALAGSALASTTAAAHLGQRFPMPAFRMPQQPVSDPSRIQQNQSGNMLSSLGMQAPNHSQMPNFANSYQQYLSLHQGQLPLQQSPQQIGQPGTGKDTINMENHHPPRS